MARRRNKSEERDIATTRLAALLRAARAEAPTRPDLADRYGRIALEVAQKHQTGLPRDAKAQVCRRCGAFASTSTRRVRMTGGRVTTTCLKCGLVQRRPLAPKEGKLRKPAVPAARSPSSRSAQAGPAAAKAKKPGPSEAP